jgi:hypothetical protein
MTVDSPPVSSATGSARRAMVERVFELLAGRPGVPSIRFTTERASNVIATTMIRHRHMLPHSGRQLHRRA